MARRPSPIFAVLGGLTALAAVSAVGWIAWDQTRPSVKAPNDVGVCWRMHTDAGGVRFVPLSRNIDNLESCAATLESLYLDTPRPLQGAYQGRFIFVDVNAIQSATELDGVRWRIFYGAQREALDKKIRDARQRAAAGLPPVPSRWVP